MSQKLITVFGGSGFIGRYLVRELTQRGHRVRIATRRPNEALHTKPLGDVGQVEPVQANIRNRPSIDRAVAGADVVINLCGILKEGGPQSFKAVQEEGAIAIAEAAANAGAKRLIHISAIGVTKNSESEYSRTKASAEAGVKAAFPDVTIMKPSIVFGPEDGFFNKFASLARITPVLPLFGGGLTRYQPVYVVDIARAIASAIETKNSIGETYELGGPRSYTFEELMQIILQETERSAALLPLPLAIAKILGASLGWAPGAPITLDQARLLDKDNVVSEGAKGLDDLGVEATSLEVILPQYLWRFRRTGQYAVQAQ